MDAFAVTALALLTGGLLAAGWLARAKGGPAPLPEARQEILTPRVTVIVPARNERHNIERCLGSLAALDYPDFEVLVVDGASTDGTRERALAFAARDPRVRVLDEPPLPPSWVGKSWAAKAGADGATGEFLLFTDADTVHAPESLARAMTAAMEEDLEFLTGLTAQVLPTWWERVVMPPIFLTIGTAVRGISTRALADERHAVGNGQYLLFSRLSYDRIGGHAAVAPRIGEDLALARLAARAGLRSAFVDLTGEVRVRMYRTPREMWRGWRKNVSEGFVVTPPVAFTMTALVGAQGTLAVPLAGLALAAGSPIAAGAALAAYAHLAWRIHRTARAHGRAAVRDALLHPFGFWFFDLVLAASLLDRVTGRGHEWKGRYYRSYRPRG